MQQKRSAGWLVLVAGLCWSLATGWSLDVTGRFSTDMRFGLKDGALLFNQEYGTLTFAQQVSDNLSAVTSLELRYFGNPLGDNSLNEVLATQELGRLYSVHPFELILDEAYFTYLNFIFERLDLTAGKQRISWGAADRLNPTDVLNPLDFSDLFDFGKKTPSPALSLTYTFPGQDTSWQVVFAPYSQVARFNPLMLEQLVAGVTTAYTAAAANLTAAASGMGLTFDDKTTVWDELVRTPDINIKNFVIGTRLAASFWGFDVSANYATRINDLPCISLVQFDTSLSDGSLNLDSRSYELAYYREHEAGFDIVKDFGFLLAWAEAAVFFQPEQQLITRFTGPVASETVTTLIPADPYVKYTVGFDKNFGAGLYLNMQFNHGFFNERGRNGITPAGTPLQDYLLTRLEWRTLSDKLTFGLTGLANTNLYHAFRADSFLDYLKDNYGLLGGFEIEYRPVVSLALKLGLFALDAQSASSLFAMRDHDMAYLKFEYSF